MCEEREFLSLANEAARTVRPFLFTGCLCIIASVFQFVFSPPSLRRHNWVFGVILSIYLLAIFFYSSIYLLALCCCVPRDDCIASNGNAIICLGSFRMTELLCNLACFRNRDIVSVMVFTELSLPALLVLLLELFTQIFIVDTTLPLCSFT